MEQNQQAIMTEEQKNVFNRYIEKHCNHYCITNKDMYIGFFEYEIESDDKHALKIKSSNVIITLYKKIDHIIITIL